MTPNERGTRWTSWLRKQWFLGGLLLALVAGSLLAEPLEWLADHAGWRGVIVFVVMFLMSAPLETRVVGRTLRRPLPALLATLVSFVVVPLYALAGSQWLDPESARGLLVVAATPCTLASAAVWTNRAGGNEVVALMTTVVTNAICFVVTPLLIVWTTGLSAGISAGEMSLRLLGLVLVPLALGQCVRLINPLSRLASQHKPLWYGVAQIGVLLMVFTGTVKTWNLLPAGSTFPVSTLMTVTLVCMLVHLLALASGFQLARLLGRNRGEQIAVGIAGSQKTLMVGLLVCLMLQVSLVPMVIYHVVQLLLDTLIADRWARSTRGQPVPHQSARGKP